MKKSTLKNLSAIICFFICGMFSVTSNAQIVYTNLNPDISLKCDKPNCNKTYSLDLNNDGTADFNITVYTSATSPERGIYITPLNGDSVVIVTPPVCCIQYYFSPSAFVEGYAIGPGLTWKNSANPYIYPPYMYLRGYNNNVCHYEIEYGCQYYYDYVGSWPEKSDRYLGLKFILNGQTYYGWAQLSVSVTATKWTTSCKIKDYAFESTPNVAIMAGNKGTSAVTKSSTNNEPENHNVDELKFKIAPNPVSFSTNISFTLNKTEKVSLRIYDMTGRLIRTLTDAMFTTGRHEVEWNTAKVGAGIYILRMETAGYSESRKLIVMK